MAQFQVDYTIFSEVNPWVTETLNYANSQGIPIWNADDWLTFTEKRNGASYDALSWNSSTQTLSFNLNATAEAGMTLSTILPLNALGRPLQTVQVDGVPTAFSFQVIKGQNVAFLTVPMGNHTVVVDYANPIPVALPNAAPTRAWYDTATVTLSWSGISWADEYQIEVSPDSLFVTKLTLPNNGIVASNTLSLDVTLPNTGTYYWRVRAKDPQTGWKAFSKAESFAVDF